MENNKDFAAINVFKKLDLQSKGNINSLDLVEFFRVNDKVLPEADAFLLINANDSD